VFLPRVSAASRFFRAPSLSSGLALVLAAGVSLFVPGFGWGEEELIAAARRGDGTVARAAIEDGVDVNARAADGTTALHWAVYRDDVGLIERLIAAGADVAAANEFGSTPLAEAATVGNAAVLRALPQVHNTRSRRLCHAPMWRRTPHAYAA
jgi:hypothetical protein